MFLGYLLRYFSGEFSDQTGYLLATGVIISVMYYTISHHPSFFSVVHLNMKIRIACSALLYSKVRNFHEFLVMNMNITVIQISDIKTEPKCLDANHTGTNY